jgi:hypothetical protein
MIKKHKQNYISILALVILFLLLMMGSYFTMIVLTEFQISDSHVRSTQTYYLAETGINEAIWKLKNDTATDDGDDAWATKFVSAPDCQNFNDSFTRNNVLYAGSTYTVTINNSECARGEIVSTAKITLANGSTTQRVVKTKVFKSINSDPTGSSGVFTGGPSEVVRFTAGIMNLYKGNLFTNNNLLLQLATTLNIYDDPDTAQEEGKVLAVNNITKSDVSVINATGKCSKNLCQGACDLCPPNQISMPMIDFDSADILSYKSRAEVLGTVYTSTEFEELLWQNQNLVINDEVTYVTGGIEMKGGQSLTVNGVLVADGTVILGEKECWGKGKTSRCGNSGIAINRPAGKPAGLLTKGKLNVGIYTNEVTINGLMYVNDELKLISLPFPFNIVGGMMARKISLTSLWNTFNVTLDVDVINDTIGNPTFSPIVQIEHWEETY